MEYKGHTIEIHQDIDAESPREWDNLGIMYCEHGRYTLGDKDAAKPTKEDGEIVSLPLYLYDHGGLTMNTGGFSCPWDSGQVGIIWAKKGAEGLENDRILDVMRQEVKTYDDYLTGNVYGYNIPALDDSCWGYYGYDHEKSGLLEAARGEIDYHVRITQQIRHAKIKAWILNNVPFMHRKFERI